MWHSYTPSSRLLRRPVSCSGLAAALGRPSFALLILAIALLRVATMWHGLAARFEPNDFSIYYCSAVTMRDGGNPYRTGMPALARRLGLDAGYTAQANNAPPMLLALEPLSLMTPHHAYWAWQAVNFAALLLSIFLLLRPAYSGLSTPMALALAGFAILFPAVGNHLGNAQGKMLTLLALVAMMRLTERGHDPMAGVALGLAGLTQVFPLLLGGYLLLMRRWRALAYAAGTVVLGGLVTVALMGAGNSLCFFSAVSALASERWLSEPSNVSLAASISRVVWWLSGAARTENVELIRRVCIFTADAAVMWMTVNATDWRSGEDRDWRAFSLWVMAAVMIAPTAWFHYLILMLIPFAQAGVAANRGTAGSRVVWTMAATYMLVGAIGSALQVAHGDVSVVRTFQNIEFISAIACFVATCRFAFDAGGRAFSPHQAAEPRPFWAERLAPYSAMPELMEAD
jgi:hypothetical protein